MPETESKYESKATRGDKIAGLIGFGFGLSISIGVMAIEENCSGENCSNISEEAGDALSFGILGGLAAFSAAGIYFEIKR